MKTVEELGISPMPWKVVPYNHTMEHDTPALGDVDSCDESIIEDTRLVTFQNARLIAAAPELYECLREAAMEFCVNMCDLRCGKSEDDCFVKKWIHALAKAGGEEVECEDAPILYGEHLDSDEDFVSEDRYGRDPLEEE